MNIGRFSLFIVIVFGFILFVYHTEFRVTNSAGYTALDDRIVTVSSEEAIQQIDEEADSGFLPSLSVTSVIFLLGLISLIRNKRK